MFGWLFNTFGRQNRNERPILDDAMNPNPTTQMVFDSEQKAYDYFESYSQVLRLNPLTSRNVDS